MRIALILCVGIVPLLASPATAKTAGETVAAARAVGPPPATTSSNGRTVRLVRGSYCWTRGGRRVCQRAKARVRRPVLRLDENRRLTIRLRFDPTRVVLRVGDGRRRVLAPEAVNSIRVSAFDRTADMSVRATSGRGTVTYLGRLRP